jgi:hypothetical protein
MPPRGEGRVPHMALVLASAVPADFRTSIGLVEFKHGPLQPPAADSTAHSVRPPRPAAADHPTSLRGSWRSRRRESLI